MIWNIYKISRLNQQHGFGVVTKHSQNEGFWVKWNWVVWNTTIQN